MKKVVAFILIAMGASLMLFGGYRAVSALSGLYQANIKDALGQPEGSEQEASRAMIRGVQVGAIGVPFFLAGSVMLKVMRRRGRMARDRAAGRAP